MAWLDNKIVVVFNPRFQCDLWIANCYRPLDSVATSTWNTASPLNRCRFGEDRIGWGNTHPTSPMFEWNRRGRVVLLYLSSTKVYYWELMFYNCLMITKLFIPVLCTVHWSSYHFKIEKFILVFRWDERWEKILVVLRITAFPNVSSANSNHPFSRYRRPL